MYPPELEETKISLRLTKQEHQLIKEAADQDKRSMNTYIVLAAINKAEYDDEMKGEKNEN